MGLVRFYLCTEDRHQGNPCAESAQTEQEGNDDGTDNQHDCLLQTYALLFFVMLTNTECGLYCKAGDFYIDPTRSVEKAVITHAHADHARRGMTSYLTHTDNAPLLRHRLHKHISVQTLDYREPLRINDALISLHPSAHMLGASQIRIEVGGEVWVVTGDYKRETDPLAESFEVVPCHTLITECTFGLPVYRWFDQKEVFADLNHWWKENADNGVISVIKAYSLGKAQRILLNLDLHIGPVYCNQSVFDANRVIREAGHTLPPTPIITRQHILDSLGKGAENIRKSLVIAAGSVSGVLTGLPYKEVDVSGWTLVKRFRQRAGFPISDHADWPGLLNTVSETQCERVLAVHGFTDVFARYLREQGLDASSLESPSGRTELNTAEHENWLHTACIDHVGSDREVEILCSNRAYQPLYREIKNTLGSTSGFYRASNSELMVIRCVLLHLHGSQGSMRIEYLTMGVWKDNTVVPFAQVGMDMSDELISEIQRWAEQHTTEVTGPIRTVLPHFVFDIAVTGLTPAPRRKCGVRVTTAVIKEFVGSQPITACTTHHLSSLLHAE